MSTNYLSQINVDNENYKIKDSELRQQLSSLSASSIPYDPSSSPLIADDVQEAIDAILTTMQPKLTVIVSSGSSLTITNGTTTITGVATTGTFTTEIPKFGTWTITATLNSKTTTDTVSITELGREYQIELEFFSATLSITTDSGAEVYLDGVSKGIATSGTLLITITKSGTYTVNSEVNGISSEEQTATFTTDEEVISKTLNFRKISLTAPSGSSITLTDGDTTYTDTSAGAAIVYYIPNNGTWTATATLSGESKSDSVVVNAYQTYSIELAFVHIYGVEWDGSSSTVLSRTDESALFVDPNPYVADGNHPGSSPFDNLMPWSGMRRVTFDGNELVEIPKFWYKITKTGSAMTFQIANGPVEGFSVSPAHMDRGDGAGERDYVYVGRYHCSSTDYKSTSDSSPKVSITRSTARTSIHNLGSDYWQFDFAMFWTIRMLYIVEFADWDSQKVIGYGCGNGSSVVTMGYTDSMPYHTGTMASSRTTYAASTQYRYIEGIWDNGEDWCDGIRFSSSTIYTYLNPSTYSDSSGGTNTGTRPTSSDCISAFSVPSAAGYEWALYPSSVVSDSSYSTYVADLCYYSSSGVALHVGGYYQNRYNGMFQLYGNSTSSGSSTHCVCRLQYLPSTIN